jgi:hypothetical protein
VAVFGLAASALASCSSSSPPPSTTSCPLTDLPTASVPQRPALGVKVDNSSPARPQSGLNDADIVFEEPVEGGITRYVAVFQCENSAMVGPIRSARNIDIGILGQFGEPLMAFVGGIDPVLSNIAHSPIVPIDLRFDTSVVHKESGRVAPFNTYAATSALWNLHPDKNTPPSPVFRFSSTPPAGTPTTSVSIAYTVSPVVWKYDATTKQYLRFYGSSPDNLANGTQNSAANVIVQVIHVTFGPWVEDAQGSLEVQANLYQNASGPAKVFRNGEEITGTWSRNSLDQPTSFVSSTGTPIALQPGRTWVELVPSTVTVSAG